MDNRQITDDSDARSRQRKKEITYGVIIFLLGAVAGVAGIIAAVKLIFYLGVAVIVVAAIAVIYWIVRARKEGGDD